MGENDFNIGDAERILKSIFPSVGEDPLGKILEEIVNIQEDSLAFEAGHAADMAKMFDELDSINSRTFGILFLQIIKTVRTLMGLLPAGKFILLAIAAAGLVMSYLEGDEITPGRIVDAVRDSGLGEFIQEQLKAITAIANNQADQVEDIVELANDILSAEAAKVSHIVSDIDYLNQLLSFENDDRGAWQVIRDVQAILVSTTGSVADLDNLTANADTLILGTLRAIPPKIRAIPQRVISMMS